MKYYKYVFAISLIISLAACSDNSDDPILIVEENPLAEYNLISSFKANSHDIEIYSEESQFTIGYNQLFMRIKDEVSDAYISNAEISWMPMMHMIEMEHSCPKSAITKTVDASVYTAYAVFQMPGNTDEYWDLSLEYVISGEVFNVTERIEVKLPSDGKKRVNSIMGSDGKRYILAMMPMEPQVAINDFSAMLFKMENMMSFPSVEGYKIKMDPRMPSMGNHSSPNNEDLVYNSADGMYKGKLSLTMTGYWKINLQLLNEGEEVLKGEEITDDNENSSLFFELEF